MKLTIPITYTLNVVPPRCRKPREEEFTGSCEVEIREVEATAAPIAIEVSGDRNTDAEQYRYYDGKLWARHRDRYDGGETPATAETLSGLLPKSFRMKPERAAKEELADHAADFLIVAGLVWTVTDGEPFYKVSTFGLGGSHGGVDLDVDTYWPDAPRSAHRADRFEEARAHAIREARRRQHTRDLAKLRRMKPAITVHIPEALRLPLRATCTHADATWYSITPDEIGEALSNDSAIRITGLCKSCGSELAVPFAAASPVVRTDDLDDIPAGDEPDE